MQSIAQYSTVYRVPYTALQVNMPKSEIHTKPIASARLRWLWQINTFLFIIGVKIYILFELLIIIIIGISQMQWVVRILKFNTWLWHVTFYSVCPCCTALCLTWLTCLLQGSFYNACTCSTVECRQPVLDVHHLVGDSGTRLQKRAPHFNQSNTMIWKQSIK